MENSPNIVLHCVEEFDCAELAQFIDEAWSHDYPNSLRVLYSKSYLQWISSCDTVSIIARAPTHGNEIVGFIHGIKRNLHINGEELPIFHTTLVTVSPNYRRLGIGTVLHEALMENIFSRGYKLLMSVYHYGKSGLSMNVKANKNSTQRDIKLIAQANILTKNIEQFSSTSCREYYHLTTNATGDLLFSGSPMHDLNSKSSVKSLRDIQRRINSGYKIALDLQQGYSGLYLTVSPIAGTLFFPMGENDDHFFISSYVVCDASFGESESYKIFQIQVIFNSGCDANELLEIFGTLSEFAVYLGCRNITLYEQGLIDRDILRKLYFIETGEKMIVSLRGLAETMDSLGDIIAPLYVDFI